MYIFREAETKVKCEEASKDLPMAPMCHEKSSLGMAKHFPSAKKSIPMSQFGAVNRKMRVCLPVRM